MVWCVARAGQVITLSSSNPELSKSELSGNGLKDAYAGRPAHLQIKFVDQFSNVARRATPTQRTAPSAFIAQRAAPRLPVIPCTAHRSQCIPCTVHRSRCIPCIKCTAEMAGTARALQVALPGEQFLFGLALDKEKQKLSPNTEPSPFEGSWQPGDTGVYQIQYLATMAGTLWLHVWCDPNAEGERVAFPGSPFSLHVFAGEASATATLSAQVSACAVHSAPRGGQCTLRVLLLLPQASASVSRVDGWQKISREEKTLSSKSVQAADPSLTEPHTHTQCTAPGALRAQCTAEVAAH